jgi:hypothetical protein
MGLEGKSINKVKIQPVPASTKRERNSDPADSGKKVLPGVERFRLFCGLAQRRDSLFCLCPRLFRRSAFPAIRNVSFGECQDKGECAEGFKMYFYLNKFISAISPVNNKLHLKSSWETFVILRLPQNIKIMGASYKILTC